MTHSMNIVETCELFEYLNDNRSKFLQTFRSIGWEEFSKDRGATWGSMLGIFLHILDVEEGWLLYRAKKATTVGEPDRKAADYHSFDQLVSDNSKVNTLTHDYLSSLTDEDLGRDIVLRFPDGNVLQRKLSKILMHAAFDELAHIGELICLLWRLDVEPPYIEWLDYRV